MDNKGQFTIIAALLVAIVLAGTLIAVYATIRYDSSQSQTPQTLTSTDETNSAILKALGFTVGYYGSILQVTGNQTYALGQSKTYMESALQYIENMNPSLGESINMTSLNLGTTWFSNPSISTGTLSVVYNLADLGIYGVNYTTSCSLGVQIFNSPNSNQVCLNVTQDLNEPLTSLGQQNFDFYFYNYTASDWQLINSNSNPTIFTNGTYLINIPSEVTSSSFMVQVTDSRGIMVEASSFNSYNINFGFSSQSSSAPTLVELLQNGTMLWSGQDLLNTTQAQPIPPVPVMALNLCQNGATSDIPFQVEDWASGYMIPLGLSSNYTIFSSDQMLVFEVSPSMSQLTLWWNGSDTAVQSSAAYVDTCFTVGSSTIPSLSNGNMTLQFSYPEDSAGDSIFQVTSNVNGVTSTTNFMRINRDNSTYGSGSPAFIIEYGVVRDIVQEEGEWGNEGPTNCSDVYSQIALTFPANATYFTYQLRLIFVNASTAPTASNISDISLIRLTTSATQPQQAITENGITNGILNVTLGPGIFNDSTGNSHDWSELINSASQGAGIMFTDSENQQLYAFDNLANNEPTGAINITGSIIELDPVTCFAPVLNFNSALDLTWYGDVATFNGVNPIYNSSGNSGIWPLVAQPPSVTINPQSAASTSITISPSIGSGNNNVVVSGGGFIPDSQITITVNGNTTTTIKATAYGEIPLGTTVFISATAPGGYTIAATDTSSDSASANYIIPPVETINFQVSGIGSDAGSSTILTIDSVNYTYSTLPAQFSWPAESTHTITASGVVAAGAGKQYVWASWIDGGAQTHTYIVPSANTTVTASFGTQWQVTFSSPGLDASTASGTVLTVNGTNVAYSGLPYNVWVNNDDGLVYTYNASVSSTTAGKQFILGSVSPVSPLVGITSALAVTGSYTTQYQLTLTSNFGTTIPAGGSTWYNAGSTVTISATAPNAGAGEQYSWNGWAGTGSGSYTGTNNPAANAVTMNAAVTEAASWIHQYQVTVTASPSGAIGGTFLVTYTMSGTTHTNEQHTTPWTQWIDASKTVTLSSPQSSFSGYTFGSYTSNPVTVNSAQTISLMYYGPLDHFAFNTITTPQTAGTTFSITITAMDAYGNVVANYAGSNSLSVSTGTINPTTTGTFSSGVWTGSVTVTGAGSGVTISTSGSSKSGTSGSFTVNPGALDHFAFTSISSPQTAGTAITGITITAMDANNNIVTSYASSTSITETNGGSGGTVSPASVTFSGGQWSGSLTLTASGTGATITASGGGKTGTSSSFTVNSGPLDHFIFNTIASPQTVNSAFSITIKAVDVNLNTVTSYTSTNTLSASVGTISPATTTAFAAGVWTGSVTLNTVGSSVSISTSDGTQTGTSNTFTVSTAPPALDGEASTNTISSGIMTISLKTTKANDVLYLSFVGGGSTDINYINSTGTSAWTQRGYVQTEDSTHHLSTWYATWTSSGTITITITLKGTNTHCAAVVFGINGANMTAPFDGNATTNYGNSATASVGITTTHSNDLIIGSLGIGITTAPTNGSGYTSIATESVSSSRETSDEYCIASATGTYTPTYTFSSNPWGIIADAIKSS